jgi:hypothetical protein
MHVLRVVLFVPVEEAGDFVLQRVGVAVLLLADVVLMKCSMSAASMPLK